MSPLVARTGHAGSIRRRLLLRVERTCRSSEPTSDFDPERTLIGRHPAMRRCPICPIRVDPAAIALRNCARDVWRGHMQRRLFITALGGAVVTWPLAARAQRLDRVRRIGVLLPYIESDSQAQARVTALQTALQKRGWASGRNVAFEFRYAEGQLDRLPALAADLVHTNVDVILTAGTE